MPITFEKIDIPDAYIITSFCAIDNRGMLSKNFERKIFMDHGINFRSDEDFISCSAKNVIRGLHFQRHNPQAKLVGVCYGMAYDVLVDLRKDSPTFGKWHGEYLSRENGKNLYIPRGCAHGFLSMVDNTVVSYKCDGAYDKETDTGIIYCDEELSIKWPIEELSKSIVGERDQRLIGFSQFIREYGGF